jgi:hypothetical protein
VNRIRVAQDSGKLRALVNTRLYKLTVSCFPHLVVDEYRIRMEGIYLNVSVNMYLFMRINNEVTVASECFSTPA